MNRSSFAVNDMVFLDLQFYAFCPTVSILTRKHCLDVLRVINENFAEYHISG